MIISNFVVIVIDGIVIFGFGNIGFVVGMFVMEGKAVFFDQLVGISGILILFDIFDLEEIICMVKYIFLGFSGILFEDIGLFYCFDIEDCLKEELDILVMYDDQYGMVVVIFAVVIFVCKSVGFDLKEVKVGQIGFGVVGVVICCMFMVYGVKVVCGMDKLEDVMNCFV